MTRPVVTTDQRRAEIGIAVLFLITAAAAISGGLLYEPILAAPDYLAGVVLNKSAVAMGALLMSINNIGIVFIAVFAFPLLRTCDETLAIGYSAVRIIESTLMMVGVTAVLLTIPLSEAFAISGAQGSGLVAIGKVLLEFKVLALTDVSLVLLGLGGLILCWVLLRFQLVHRLIAVVGLIGYALILCAGLGAWFDVIDMSGAGWETVLAAPVGLFEIVLMPAWLYFRGFRNTKLPGPLTAVTA